MSLGKKQKPNTPKSREGTQRARKGGYKDLNRKKKPLRCIIKHRRLVDTVNHKENVFIYTEKHLKCWHTCTKVGMKFN